MKELLKKVVRKYKFTQKEMAKKLGLKGNILEMKAERAPLQNDDIMRDAREDIFVIKTVQHELIEKFEGCE